jgi:Zn-dependent protease
VDVTLIVIALGTLLFSGIFHEQAHARVALWLGDPTGRDDDRLSWNPKHHIDPWMSIALPAILLVTSGGRWWFGGMKPVRINTANFENPTFGMAVSALAGPVSNFILAGAGLGILWVFHRVAPDFIYQVQTTEYAGGFTQKTYHLTLNGLFFGAFIFTNVTLGAFNLLPLPGLDGSRILYHFLPRGGREFMDRMEPYALTITMVAVYLGATRILAPLYGVTAHLLVAVTRLEFVDVLFERMWSGR